MTSIAYLPTWNLRRRGEEQQVAPIELFFDLVYVFAVTQLSHRLLDQLSVRGAFETAVLLAMVWLVWIYTTWVTNWLDPQRLGVRVLLLVLMPMSLVLSACLPEAFGSRGPAVGIAYAAMQIGRSVFAVLTLSGDPLGLAVSRSEFIAIIIAWFGYHRCAGAMLRGERGGAGTLCSGGRPARPWGGIQRCWCSQSYRRRREATSAVSVWGYFAGMVCWGPQWQFRSRLLMPHPPSPSRNRVQRLPTASAIGSQRVEPSPITASRTAY